MVDPIGIDLAQSVCKYTIYTICKISLSLHFSCLQKYSFIPGS